MLPRRRTSKHERGRWTSLPTIVALTLATCWSSTANAEERHTGVIRLEEITTYCAVPFPNIFFHVEGQLGIAPSSPAETCGDGAGRSDSRCMARADVEVDYSKAYASWLRLAAKRRQLLESAKRRTATLGKVSESPNRPRSKNQSVLPLSFIEDTDERFVDEPLRVTVVHVDGPTTNIGQTAETLHQARGAVKGCFDSALEPDAAFRESVPLLLKLGGDGQVADVRATGTGTASAIGKCIASIVSTQRFPVAPRAEDAIYGVFFRALNKSPERRAVDADERPDLGASQKVTNAPRDASIQPPPPGQLTIGTVRQLLIRARGDLVPCYRRALRERPGLAGRLTLSFTVGWSGRTVSDDVSESELPPEVGHCISERVRSLRFPRPEGGQSPFTFTFYFRD